MKIKAKKIDERIAENYTKIKFSGIGEVYIGDELIFTAKNKWTRYFMSSIIVFIANTTAYIEVGELYHGGMSYGATARVGTDTTTTSHPNMSDIVSKVDIAPDSITRRAIKEPDYTLYIAEFVFTWSAGTLPDTTVGELGVYLRTDGDDWVSGTSNPARGTSIGDTGVSLGNADVRLASRIASADGAFDPFEFYGSIDPLTFKWRFQVAVV